LGRTRFRGAAQAFPAQVPTPTGTFLVRCRPNRDSARLEGRCPQRPVLETAGLRRIPPPRPLRGAMRGDGEAHGLAPVATGPCPLRGTGQERSGRLGGAGGPPPSLTAGDGGLHLAAQARPAREPATPLLPFRSFRPQTPGEHMPSAVLPAAQSPGLPGHLSKSVTPSLPRRSWFWRRLAPAVILPGDHRRVCRSPSACRKVRPACL